jgi:quercetin dioxygenase-like cupin family protein
MTPLHVAQSPLEPRIALGPLALADLVRVLAGGAAVWCRDLPSHQTRRTSLRLLATEECDVWLLRWPPGTGVTPHDHGGSSGAFTVVRGELTEVRWDAALPYERFVSPGQVVSIEAGVVHDVLARDASPALSIHAYSPPLSSMGFYDATGQGLLVRQPVDDRSITVE